jgi:hypothetical protein
MSAMGVTTTIRVPVGHRPSRNVSGTAVRDRDPTIRVYFSKNLSVITRHRGDAS